MLAMLLLACTEPDALVSRAEVLECPSGGAVANVPEGSPFTLEICREEDQTRRPLCMPYTAEYYRDSDAIRGVECGDGEWVLVSWIEPAED